MSRCSFVIIKLAIKLLFVVWSLTWHQTQQLQKYIKYLIYERLQDALLQNNGGVWQMHICPTIYVY